MKTQGSRSYLKLVVFVVLLLQLMVCRLPTKEESGGRDFNPSDVSESNYTVNVTSHAEVDCEEVFIPPDAKSESFEFVEDTLIVTRDNDKSAYTKISGTNEYCRTLEGESEECIQWVSNKEYLHVVREPDVLNSGEDRYCYEASRHLSVSEDNKSDDKKEDGEDGEIKGTYKGMTDLPISWAEYPGTDFVNEITIVVAGDGTVTGTLSVIREGEALVVDENCVTFTDFDVSGAPSGQLTDIKGAITIQMDYYFETRYTEACASETVEFSEVYELDAEITISGKKMTGTILEFFTFEATKD